MSRKKPKKDRSEEAEVPISAMIDVVFLLLIYFIVTSKEIVDEAWVSVNLPGPPPPDQPKIEPPPTIDIFVQSDRYIYQGNDRSLDEMERTLMGLGAAMGEDVTINIKVSLKAKHQMLVLLLDRMNKHKLSKFNLHTLKDPLSQ
ncbi:MAG: biopolymer transporter ExbD [Lentisphaeraceae bacterium]|nr:biopolymer transporter ExbD [Lentisphaeraceae bacterium]